MGAERCSRHCGVRMCGACSQASKVLIPVVYIMIESREAGGVKSGARQACRMRPKNLVSGQWEVLPGP